MSKSGKALASIIGRNIRKYREKVGLTQAELAEAVGVGNAFISRVERGEKLMKLETLYMIASELEVSCDALLYIDAYSTHISNIQRMLADQSLEFITGVEDIIRVCVNSFGEKDLE